MSNHLDTSKIKKNYKGLSVIQRRYIKAWERLEIMNKYLESFCLRVPKGEDGEVKWTSLPELDLDCFDFYNSEKERAIRTMNRWKNLINIDMTLSMFRQINI